MNESAMAPSHMANTGSLDETSSASNDTKTMYGPTYSQRDINWILKATVPPVLLVLGCFGNIMIIVVMLAMRASESLGCLSVYFNALAVSDLCLVWTSVGWFWPGVALGIHLTYFHDLTCTFSLFLRDTFSMTSAWCLVAMTCQRMMSVVVPHRVDVLCTVRNGKIVTAAVVVVSGLTNLYVFFSVHLTHVAGRYPMCVYFEKTIGDIFGNIYLYVASLIPFLVLLVANSFLIFGVLRSVKMVGKMAGHGNSHTSARSAKAFSMTVTLIMISMAFLLLTMPRCVLWIHMVIIDYMEGKVEDETVRKQVALAHTVCNLLWMTNSSINFYIYILSGKKFKQEAKRNVCLCLTRRQRPAQ